MGRQQGHVIAAILIVVACVSGALMLLSASHARIPSRTLPQSIRDVLPAGGGGAQHVILYSAQCQWCRKQLEVLSRLVPPVVLHIIVLTRRDEDRPRLEGVPNAVVSYVRRASLEREVGQVATPQHLFIDQSGSLSALVVGYRNADKLAEFYRQLDASARERDACGDRCGEGK